MIVIIAILAAITIVAYNGIQERARNADRDSGVASIEKMLEIYYADNGSYPSSASCMSTTINSSWCTTGDASWDTFRNRLNGGAGGNIISTLPQEPAPTPGVSPLTSSGNGRGIAYFATSTQYCNAPGGQWYLLAYTRDGGNSAQIDRRANCSGGTAISTYPVSSEVFKLK